VEESGSSIYSFLAWSIKNVFDGNVFTGYLYNLVNHTNSKVGLVAGINGLSMLTLAPFIGIVSDKYGRIILLRVACIIGIFAIILTVYSITIDSYKAIILTQILFAAYWELTSPTMNALLADWTDTGTRSQVYVVRSVIIQMASTIGPLMSIFLFLYLGNTWDMDICRDVIYVGLVLFLIPLTLLYVLFPKSYDNDCTKKSTASNDNDNDIEYDQLPFESTHDNGSTTSSCTNNDNDNDNNAVEMTATAISTTNELHLNKRDEHEVIIIVNSNVHEDDHEDKDEDEDDKDAIYCTPFYLRNILYVPSMIAFHEVITMLASGMTVKFFPIFFLHILGLNPIHVQIIYLINPIMCGICTIYTQKFSKRYGRIEIACFVKLIGTTMLFILAYLTYLTETAEAKGLAIAVSNGDIDTDEDGNPLSLGNINVSIIGNINNTWKVLMIIIFLLRTSIMNSVKPLTTSISMDFVPKNQRGRWNALQSLNVFSWAGSAVIGGYLIDKVGFAGIYCTTGTMHFLSIIPLLSLRHLVPMEKDALSNRK